MKVRPKPGMIVRHPRTHAVIPEDGINVDDTDIYWARRIRQEDVEPVPEEDGQ